MYDKDLYSSQTGLDLNHELAIRKVRNMEVHKQNIVERHILVPL